MQLTCSTYVKATVLSSVADSSTLSKSVGRYLCQLSFDIGAPSGPFLHLSGPNSLTACFHMTTYRVCREGFCYSGDDSTGSGVNQNLNGEFMRLW